LNLIGLKRRGLSRESINAMRAAYRSIFLEAGDRIAARAKRARDTWKNIDEIAEIVDFILADAHQPLCTARRSGSDVSGD
jgi:UDP-N-acetylglucosamine acyltransferase